MARLGTVACKLPNGIILRLFDMVEQDEPVMGGGVKTVKRAHMVGEPVTLKGNRVPFGETAPFPIIGGYALTHNVDMDFFDAWLKQNADHDIVRNKLIFAAEKGGEVESKAKTLGKTTRSGLEPIDRKNLPKGIQTADRKEA